MGQRKTYSELTKFMSIEDILKRLRTKLLGFKNLLDFIVNTKIVANDERRFVDINILKKVLKELQRIDKNALDNESLAHATRNMFELNMIYRYTVLSTDNLKEWLGNKLQDEIDILEGILKLSENRDGSNEQIIIEQISHIRLVAQNYNIKVSRQLTTKILAGRVGLALEYEGLFKLYSKFVHPTSWLINSKEDEINSFKYKNVLLIQFQTYLFDLESRLLEFYDFK